MKVEVGKFYKNRIGEKVKAVRYGNGGDVVFLSDGNCVFKETGNANYEWGSPTDNDLIEEWKEPEVKEPKFKVGDRVTKKCGKWISETGNKIVKITDKDYYIAPSWDESISNPYPIEVWDDRLELVETKPEITVGSRWTNIGKASNIITVVHVNDKYVAFEHDGRETIGSTTVDLFHKFYAPYVQPPKSLVGYVVVIDDGDYQRFTLVCESEEEVRSTYSVTNYNIVAIKKIEWTEGE